MAAKNFPFLKFLDGEIRIGVDANLAGNSHGFHGEIFGIQLRMLQQGARAGQSVGTSGTDGHNAVVGFDYITVAGKNEGAFGVGDDQQGFEMAKGAIFAPLFGELNGGFLQVAGMFLKLAFEAFE